MKPYDQLEFSDDFMFCKIMQNKSICKRVLETLLKIKIKKLNFVQKQKSIDESYKGKGVRLDVYTEDDNNVYDIEMQTSVPGNLGLRSRYYQSIIDIEHLEKGIDYEKLKTNIIIFICLKDPFDKNLPAYKFISTCCQNDSVKINDKIEKYFYNSSAYLLEKDPEIKAFLEFINTKTAVSGLTTDIQSAVQKAKFVQGWRKEYMTWNLAINDAKKRAIAEGLAEGIAAGRAEGMAKGRAEGIQLGISEAKNATILEMLKDNVPFEQISKWTKISVEEIQKIAGHK